MRTDLNDIEKTVCVSIVDTLAHFIIFVFFLKQKGNNRFGFSIIFSS